MAAERFTFSRRLGAHTTTRKSLVYVPDQVLEEPQAFDGRAFPVMRRDGAIRRAVLRGELFGLGTDRAGDPVVTML